jgi:hypothetical protein
MVSKELRGVAIRKTISISIKLGRNHPWVKGIRNSSNKGPGPLERGDNHKNAKFGEVSEKVSPRERLSQNSLDLHESFLTMYRFKLVQIMVPEVGGLRRGNYFYVNILKRIF